MRDDPLADRDAVAGDDVQHARREHVLRELGEAEQRERRLLGRLQHLDVAAPRAPARASRPPSSAGSSTARSRRRPRAARGGRTTCSRACTRRRSCPRGAAPRRRRSAGCRSTPASRRGRTRAACRRSATRSRRARRRSRRARRRASAAPRRARPASSRATPAAPPSPPRRAASTSSAPQRGTRAIVSSVAGFSTSIVSPDAAPLHSPPIRICLVSLTVCPPPPSPRCGECRFRASAAGRSRPG